MALISRTLWIADVMSDEGQGGVLGLREEPYTHLKQRIVTHKHTHVLFHS